jgi:hypothetical protein
MHGTQRRGLPPLGKRLRRFPLSHSSGDGLNLQNHLCGFRVQVTVACVTQSSLPILFAIKAVRSAGKLDVDCACTRWLRHCLRFTSALTSGGDLDRSQRSRQLDQLPTLKCSPPLEYLVRVYTVRRRRVADVGKYMLRKGILVDLIGIEPMTSSMPWNRSNRNL